MKWFLPRGRPCIAASGLLMHRPSSSKAENPALAGVPRIPRLERRWTASRAAEAPNSTPPHSPRPATACHSFSRMARWHLPTCDTPNVLCEPDPNTPRCHSCGVTCQLKDLVSTQTKSLALIVPPDKPLKRTGTAQDRLVTANLTRLQLAIHRRTLGSSAGAEGV